MASLVQLKYLSKRVAQITLCDALRLNALTVPMGDALQRAFAALEKRACAVVLTGDGAAF